MMGPAHSATGLAVGAATLPWAPVDGLASQIAWVLIVGGMAYAPDLDQPGSTAGRAWGPLTGALARVVGVLAGGHRNGTHDPLLAPLLYGGAVLAASLWTPTAVAVLALAIALALHALQPLLPGDSEAPILNLALSVTWAWMLVDASVLNWRLLALGAAVGVLTHILGDALTKAGVPYPLGPVRGSRGSWGLRAFTAGDPVEKPITWVSLAVAVGCTAWFVAWPLLGHTVTSAAARYL